MNSVSDDETAPTDLSWRLRERRQRDDDETPSCFIQDNFHDAGREPEPGRSNSSESGSM